jgi:octaheme c-type cytochrome (tetrathionate reductase family)
MLPLVLSLLPLAPVWADAPGQAQVPPAPPQILTDSTADHSQFEALKQSFASGPDVTEACLSCHTEGDSQVMHSIHFTWDYESESGQQLGKSNVVNAFCGNVAGNEPRCTSCHAGYGWEDMSVTPEAAGVTPDCLVCHDRSGQYTKTATGAGHPPLGEVKPGTKTITGALAWSVDLTKAAQSVGVPGRENCGQCHFYGGGGDNVKHGDLSSVLYAPDKAVDVHMSPDGGNFTCQTCHVEEGHDWAGSRYDVDVTAPHAKPGAPRATAACESCHSDKPHPAGLEGMKLNDHTDKVACQTCHIPEFARGGVATKTLWDWSTAGKMNDEGKPYAIDDYTQGNGKVMHTYMSTKGDFAYGEDVVPVYAWFNGSVEYTLPEEEIDPSQVVPVNRIAGGPDDGLIWPFKRMEGRQAYDDERNVLAFNHVWGPTTDTAFWTNFDYDKSLAAGMEAAGLAFSGEYDFVDTHMYWPITHMVAPAREALKCGECHAEDGRLSDLAGVYLPGSNPKSPVGLLGMLMLAATVLGVAGHAVIRFMTKGKREGGDHHA